MRSSQRPHSPPGRRPSGPPFLLFALILLGAGTLAAFGLYTFTAVTVTLNVDGQTIPLRTHQTTVGGVLADTGVWLESADQLTPPRDTPIQSGLVITIDHAHPLVIDVAGQPRRILTHAIDPGAILAEAAITPGAHDVIDTQFPAEIIVTHAITVNIVDGGQTRTVYTTARIVGAILAENGITLYVADIVNPDLNAPIQDGDTITIQRSLPITIQVDGRTLATRTHGVTVGSALSEAGIALVGLDQSVPTTDQPLTSDLTIHVTRITETEEVERIPLPFQTITQVDPSLTAGSQRIIQQGIAGVEEIHVRVRRVDGLEISRSTPLSWIIQPPQDQIVAVSASNTIGTPTVVPSATPNA
ncbi:MAG: ubiquitin-like domain-containing protein [Aggregatilineales bacterium]